MKQQPAQPKTSDVSGFRESAPPATAASARASVYPVATAGHWPQTGGAVLNPFYMGAAAPAYNAFYTWPGIGRSQSARFGSTGMDMAKGVQRLLDNERIHSLLFVDMPMSSGRVVTSRNWLEMLEVGFKEINIMASLFFVADWIKGKVQQLTERLSGAVAGMDIRALKRVHDGYGRNSARFHRDVASRWR